MYPLYALQVYRPSIKDWVDTTDPEPSNMPHTYQRLEKEFLRLVLSAREHPTLTPTGFRVVVKWSPPKVGAVYNLWTNGRISGSMANKCIPL
jgi:hypothetical protein